MHTMTRATPRVGRSVSGAPKPDPRYVPPPGPPPLFCLHLNTPHRPGASFRSLFFFSNGSYFRRVYLLRICLITVDLNHRNFILHPQQIVDS